MRALASTLSPDQPAVRVHASGMALGRVVMMRAVFPAPGRAGDLFHAVGKIRAAKRERESGGADFFKSIAVAHHTPGMKSLVAFFDGRDFVGGQQAVEIEANRN